jgi:hypothetical protein
LEESTQQVFLCDIRGRIGGAQITVNAVQLNQKHPLNHGDIIKIGKKTFRFQTVRALSNSGSHETYHSDLARDEKMKHTGTREEDMKASTNIDETEAEETKEGLSTPTPDLRDSSFNGIASFGSEGNEDTIEKYVQPTNLTNPPFTTRRHKRPKSTHTKKSKKSKIVVEEKAICPLCSIDRHATPKNLWVECFKCNVWMHANCNAITGIEQVRNDSFSFFYNYLIDYNFYKICFLLTIRYVKSVSLLNFTLAKRRMGEKRFHVYKMQGKRK